MANTKPPAVLLDRIAQHDKHALAQAVTRMERADAAALRFSRMLYGKKLPVSHTVGLTGAPGVGKSTCINALIHRLRAQGHTVAVLAIDPTSPFSGGAILGDRIRMGEHSSDPQVFIRSLGSRANPAGISLALPAIIALLRLWGATHILVETVGSGQLDIMIKAYVQTTVLLLSPEGGDEIQMMKAGILEIADVMVINKADRPGVEHLENQLRTWLDLLPKSRPYRAPVLRLVASKGEGIDPLIAALAQHAAFLQTTTTGDDQQEQIRFLALNLAVAIFRHDCLKQLQKLKLTKKSTSQDSVRLAQQLIKRFRGI